jgi:hypothetical protein
MHVEELANLLYWGIIGYSSICAIIFVLSLFSDLLEFREEKRRTQEYMSRAESIKKFEYENQNSPNGSIINQYIVVDMKKVEIDEFIKSLPGK